MKDSNMEEELKECQEYHYSQSSKVSTLARTVVYGMIGTLWIFIYSNNVYREPCPWIKIALGLCFFYLLLDLGHYFWDACNYRNEYFRLEREKNREGILHRHEEYMNRVSKRSYCLLIVKFISVFVISAVFLIGVLVQLKITLK